LGGRIAIKNKGSDMENQVALVTGASRGIGKAIALELGKMGATVVGTATSESGGEAISAYLKEAGVKGAGMALNVTDAAQVDAVLDAVRSQFGEVAILVNNAGITRDGQFVKMKDGELVKQMSEEAFDLVVSVNLKGVFNCTQAVAPFMIKQNSGVILNASSVVGLYGNFGQTNYVATKAGVIGMTKVWARELGKYGIRVNAVAPGFIMTEMVAKMPEEVLAGMRAKTPLGRLGEPEDIASTYLWLASDEAAYVHGATISVDGGIVLGT